MADFWAVAARAARTCGAQGGVQREVVMTTPRRQPFLVLGWQTWAILVAVLALVLAAGVWLLNW